MLKNVGFFLRFARDFFLRTVMGTAVAVRPWEHCFPAVVAGKEKFKK